MKVGEQHGILIPRTQVIVRPRVDVERDLASLVFVEPEVSDPVLLVMPVKVTPEEVPGCCIGRIDHMHVFVLPVASNIERIECLRGKTQALHFSPVGTGVLDTGPDGCHQFGSSQTTTPW